MQASQHLTHSDTITPGGSAWRAYRTAFLAGVFGLAAALVLWLIAWAVGEGFVASMRRLGYAYLLGFTFWLTVVLGCLFFVLVTHLVRAGWCVSVRRLAEHGAAAMPTLAVLFIPILVMTFANNGMLFPWADAKWEAQAEHEVETESHQPGADHQTEARAIQANLRSNYVVDDTLPDSAGYEDQATEGRVNQPELGPDPNEDNRIAGAPSEETVAHQVLWKRPYLNRWTFTLRWVIYLGVWSLTAWWFRRLSLSQDHNKDPELTIKRETRAAPAVLVFGFTLSFAAFDLVMSLDPVFYSTIFGIYIFAGCVIAGICVIVLTLMALQRRGWLPAVNVEHYHDLGKFLFAFIFFWGYIGFSQYMLIWYGSLPEETYWFQLRGATTLPTAPQFLSGWTALSLILLFGHLLLPFAFLLSRHPKRNRSTLAMACWWMLIMHLFDLFWLMRPTLSEDMVNVNWADFLMSAATLIGIGGIVVGAAIRLASQSSLIAYGDPRLHESMRLDTSAAAPLFEH